MVLASEDYSPHALLFCSAIYTVLFYVYYNIQLYLVVSRFCCFFAKSSALRRSAFCRLASIRAFWSDVKPPLCGGGCCGCARLLFGRLPISLRLEGSLALTFTLALLLLSIVSRVLEEASPFSGGVVRSMQALLRLGFIEVVMGVAAERRFVSDAAVEEASRRWYSASIWSQSPPLRWCSRTLRIKFIFPSPRAEDGVEEGESWVGRIIRRLKFGVSSWFSRSRMASKARWELCFIELSPPGVSLGRPPSPMEEASGSISPRWSCEKCCVNTLLSLMKLSWEYPSSSFSIRRISSSSSASSRSWSDPISASSRTNFARPCRRRLRRRSLFVWGDSSSSLWGLTAIAFEFRSAGFDALPVALALFLWSFFGLDDELLF